MSKIKHIIKVMPAGLVIGILLAGCVSAKKVAVIPPQPVCSEAAAGDLSDLTDSELIGLLDGAVDGSGLDDCWIPLMQASLDENREIPQAHLVKAVKTFNKRQYEPYFHKALYRYFKAITDNPGVYRPEDRKLLETYCSYLINSAESSRDRNLRQAKLLCRKLDGNLYARLFE